MGSFYSEFQPFFDWLIKTSVQSSVIILIVLAVKLLLANKLTAKWHYLLWGLVIVRMVMPGGPQSSFSIYNLMPNGEKQVQISVSEESERVAPPEDLPEVVAVEKEVAEPVKVETNSQGDMLAGSEVEVELVEVNTETETRIATVTKETPTAAVTDNMPGVLVGFADSLAFIWLCGVVVMLIYVFASNFRLWQIVRVQRPVTDGRLLDMLEDCKGQMNMHAYLAVVETDKVSSPALFGFIRPRLLLPQGISGKLELEQLRHVFLHELAHLKRGDIYVGWLTAILQTMHWFNPLVWYAFYRMRSDRELACDELALTAMESGENKGYGETIIKLLEEFSTPQYTPGLAGIMEEKSLLHRRISLIASNRKGSLRLSLAAVVIMAVIGCVALTDGLAVTNVELSPAVVKELPEEIVPMADVVVQWFNSCRAGDVEGVRETFHPDRKDVVSEKTLGEMNEVLSFNRKWEFELLSAMWDDSDAMLVSKIFVKNNFLIGKDYSLIWPLRKTEDGNWKLLGSVS